MCIRDRVIGIPISLYSFQMRSNQSLPSVSIVPEKLNRIPFMSCLFSIVLFFLEDGGKVISGGDSSQGRNGHIIVLNFGFVNFDCFCVCFTLPLYFVK